MKKTPHILLVDDDTNSRTTLAHLLSQVGYVVGMAATEQEALQLLQTGDYHLLLLDVCLMNMKGLSLLQTIRQTYPHICVLVLTACADPRVAQKTTRLGVSNYLVKPVDPLVIVQSLSDVLPIHPQEATSLQKEKEWRSVLL